MKRAIHICLEEEGQVLLKRCSAEEVGVYIKKLLMARETDKDGEILIGGHRPVPEQFASICKIEKSEYEADDKSLKQAWLLTPTGKVANYKRLADDDRRRYHQAYHQLKKIQQEVRGSSNARQQLTNSKSKREDPLSSYVFKGVKTVKDFNAETEGQSDGTRWYNWYLNVFNQRAPKGGEFASATELIGRYGFESVQKAMQTASYDGQGWWAVRKILNGEWKSRSGAKKRGAMIDRHHVDKE